MKKYSSSGGASNPDFKYKVNVSDTTTAMIDWCDAYPIEGEGYFQRYYIKWVQGSEAGYYPEATFQFEVAETAVLFKLTFGGK